ncbi:MAG: sugar ABC transporter substrate-binding protein [Gammaproteobacteria bacterium]
MLARAPLIAVFTKNRTNPAYTAARLGAERTAARHGARVVHYVPERPDNVEDQVALVEQAIAGRPDAAVFVPVHITAMDESVRKLNAARIPVVNILNRMDHGEFVTFVGSDDYRLAREIAAYLFRHIGGKGDIVVLSGIAGALTASERLRGFRDVMSEWPGIRVAATRSGDYQHDVARRVMTGLLAEFPRLDGILSANDVMSLGAIEALEAAGRSVPVIGVNAVPEAIAAIKSGKLLATVDFDAMKIACIATEAALRHLRGEKLPRHIELPVQVVDRTNYRPWDKPFEERECPRWEDVVKS